MEEIKVYKLKNDNIELSVLNVGACIYKIIYKGANRVLSYKNLEQYRTNPLHLGAVVGRVAGRISDAQFSLNGVNYKLDNNESDYCIHGGFDNLTETFWDLVKINNQAENPYIILSTKLKDGTSGFPGNLIINVKYSLNAKSIRLDIVCKSDKDTIVNITNHTYFNLNTDKNRDIKNHNLQLNADRYLAANKNCIPISIEKVDSDMDFTEEKSLSILDNLKGNQALQFLGIDHAYLINEGVESVILSNDEVCMKVSTSYPSVVCYTGNGMPDNIELETVMSKIHQGICFEAQYEPNFINADFLEKHILRAGQEYKEYIEFTFE